MSVTYISWSGDFALHLEDCLLDKCHNWDIGSFDAKIYRIKCMWVSDLPGILDPCDAKIYHIKCIWVSDLHFKVP